MGRLRLTLSRDYQITTKTGTISFSKGDVLSGEFVCEAWTADRDPDDRYSLEWKVRFDFETPQGRFRYQGFLPSVEPHDIDLGSIAVSKAPADAFCEFGPGEATDDGRDYKAVIRTDGKAVFIKNKYMGYRVGLTLKGTDLIVHYAFHTVGKDAEPEKYYPNFDAPFDCSVEDDYDAITYALPIEPMLFRNTPVFFDEDENPVDEDFSEIDDYDLTGGDTVDLVRLDAPQRAST